MLTSLVAMLFCVSFSLPTEAAQPTMRLGVNYLSDGNAYSDTTNTILTRDFTFFKNNNITDITIRLVWSAVETDTQGVYVSSVINNVKRALSIAGSLGLRVHISFWTHFQEEATWSVPAYVRDPYTGKQITLAIVRSDAMKQAWLNMVSYVVTQLRSYHAIAAWHIMNEPMYRNTIPGLDQKSNFQELWAEAATLIRSLDSQDRPCTVRFSLADSPWSGDFELASIDVLDFVGINVYVDYQDFDRLVWGSWNMVYQAIRDVHARSKQIWWTEFGAWNDNLTIQDSAYEAMLSVAQARGVDGVVAWAWQSSNRSGERYNICLDSNGHATPAFYELSSIGRSSLPGDLNGDGEVGIFDLVLVASSYNSQIGMPNYNPAADSNHDGWIDIIDLVFVSIHYGDHI
jgi:endo-1,4-beta-mannosidase